MKMQGVYFFEALLGVVYCFQRGPRCNVNTAPPRRQDRPGQNVSNYDGTEYILSSTLTEADVNICHLYDVAASSGQTDIPNFNPR